MTPVFIGGCGRSGTTFLGSVLGARPDCLCVPESPFKIDALRLHDRSRTRVRDLLEWILQTRRFKLWGLDDFAIRQSLPTPDCSYPAVLEWLVRKYGESIHKHDACFWVDHTPANIRYAATLCELFPSAKVIHIVRDGRAVACSILPLDWGPNTVDRAARWWNESLSFGLAAEAWGNSGRVVRVRYEDLVLRSEETVRTLCAFLNLEYYPTMLKADGFKLPSYTISQHALIGASPQTHRVNAWQKELALRQIEIFESLAGELLQYLGYDLQYGLLAKGPTRAERWMFHIQEMCSKKFVNRVRLRRRKAISS